LIIAFFQLIPEVSVTSGVPVVLVPLLSIVTITMVKDLYEDQMRKKADRSENERICETFNHRQVRETQWQEV
jgi:hypothetical protein